MASRSTVYDYVAGKGNPPRRAVDILLPFVHSGRMLCSSSYSSNRFDTCITSYIKPCNGICYPFARYSRTLFLFAQYSVFVVVFLRNSIPRYHGFMVSFRYNTKFLFYSSLHRNSSNIFGFPHTFSLCRCYVKLPFRTNHPPCFFVTAGIDPILRGPIV